MNDHLALMSLRSRSHVKTSMVLTRADQLFIHNYIRSYIYIYIYIYIYDIYVIVIKGNNKEFSKLNLYEIYQIFQKLNKAEYSKKFI